jgi:hypothetical protein
MEKNEVVEKIAKEMSQNKRAANISWELKSSAERRQWRNKALRILRVVGKDMKFVGCSGCRMDGQPVPSSIRTTVDMPTETWQALKMAREAGDER